MTDNTQSPLRSQEYLDPVTPYTPLVPDPNRLCSHDGACGPGDAGCRRSDILLELEKEAGFYVSGNNEWFLGDLAFTEGKYLYYYKPAIQAVLQSIHTMESNRMATDPVAAENMSKILAFVGAAGADYINTSMDVLSETVKSNPMGMPPFVSESANFYKFQNVCANKVSLVNADRDLIQTIKNSFSPTCNPFMYPFEDELYIKDGRVYALGIYKFSTLFSKMNFGFFAFNGNKDLFYPFYTLTPEQLNWLSLFKASDPSTMPVELANAQ